MTVPFSIILRQLKFITMRLGNDVSALKMSSNRRDHAIKVIYQANTFSVSIYVFEMWKCFISILAVMKSEETDRTQFPIKKIHLSSRKNEMSILDTHFV